MDGTRRYAGIDWAKDRHAVCVVDRQGCTVARFEVGHTDAGLRQLVRALAGVEGVAIERPDGPVVEALLGADLPVVVIASRHVKALRTRHGLAGNKDDRADAYVLADALRTDGHRLRPLRPDAPETVALRAVVRARKDLIRHRTALAQQLAAHLALAFPGVVDLFDELASPIARAFLQRFPSPERAAWLGPRRFDRWLAAQGYSGRRSGAELHARLVAAPPGIRGPAGSVPRRSSPRSAIVASASRRPDRSPAWPERRPRPASRASIGRCRSAGHATRSCATRSSTSRRTAATRTPGPRTCIAGHVRAARATPMRCASSPGRGSTSSGVAGRTACPTTRPATAPCNG